MAFVKTWIIVSAIALSLSLQVQAESLGQRIRDMCDKLQDKIEHYYDQEVEEHKALAFAGNWVTDHYPPLTAERKLIATWKDIKENPECTTESWSQLYLLNKCADRLTLSAFQSRVKEYADKCLTPEYTSKVVKSKASTLFSSIVHADFVDADFIKKYRADNPDDRSLHVNLLGYDTRLRYAAAKTPRLNNEEKNCCTAKKSLSAVIDAIERDFNKKGKDPKTEFKDNKAAVSKYLEKKLIKPCRRVAKHYRGLGIEIIEIYQRFEGGQEALIGALDQEAKDIIFGYRYCTSVGRQESELVNYVAKKYE